jgi:hypothetical protein
LRGDRGDAEGEFIWEIHGDCFRAPNTPDTLWLCQNSYGKWPIEIVDLPIYLLKIVIFNSYVSLPEGTFGGNWIHKDVKMFN